MIPSLTGLKRDPRYQRGVQRQLARQSPYGGTGPGVGQVAGQVAGDRARTAAGSKRYVLDESRNALVEKRADQGLDLNRERLAIRGEGLDLRTQQHTQETAFANEQNEIAKKQGRIATGLAATNLGVSGLAGLVDIKRTDEMLTQLDGMKAQAIDSGDMEAYSQAMFLQHVYS